MMKFLKKATSALLASLMCIPAGIVNISHAAESNPDGSYTVTLTDTENGLIQFSEDSMNNSSASQDGYQMMHINDDGEMEQIENDGSLWAFKAGDDVEIECIPDDGYYVESLSLKDSETGKTLSQADTVDNAFSFSMPEKNVSVEVTFSSTATINIKDDEKSKSSDDGIEYHDIVEDMDISKEEVEEVITDVITESYIKSNLNEKYISVDSDDIKMANVLLVKNTLFDGQYVAENDTIDSVISSIESGDKNFEKNVKKFISQLDAWVIVYDMNKDSDYFVACANTMIKDTAYIVQDFAVALNNLNGESVEGCIYDKATGLLYIPKALYKSQEEPDKDIFMNLQVQFMQVFNKVSKNSDESMASEVHMVSVDEKKEEIELSSSEQKIFSLKTDVTVDKGMDPENLNVLVNGLPTSKDAYTYDPETGKLSMEVSPSAVTSVEVTEGRESLSDELLDFMEKSDAAGIDLGNMSGSQLPESHPYLPSDQPPIYLSEPVDLDGMPSLRNVMYGTTSMKYYAKGSAALAGSNITMLYTGTGTNADSVATNIMNYVNGGAATNFAYIPEEGAGSSSTCPFFVNLGDFTRTSADGIPMTDDESMTINELIKQFGALGELQMYCAHIKTPAIGEHGGGNNEFAGKIAIRLLEEYHEDNTQSTDGFLIFGLYTQHMTQTTQMGSGVLKVKYKFGKNPLSDPFYFYLYKKGADGEKIESATLRDAQFEVQYYDKGFNSPESAYKNGNLIASFTFSTKSAKRNGPGTKIFKDMADDNNYDYGIDFSPKQDNDGNFIEDDDGNIINDFLVSGHEAYSKYWGKPGTYIIKEIKPPVGYLLTGKMEGYGKSTDNKDMPSTDILTNGLALKIEETKNGDGEIYHKYYINGKETNTNIISAYNEPDPDDPEILDTGVSIITVDNPDSPDMKSEAVCLDTNQQYAGSAYRTISVQDTVTIDTLEKISAKYFVTTKLYDLGTEDDRTDIPLSVSWKKKSNYSEGNKTGKEFKTEFSTGADGHVNAGSQVQFKVGATVDISDLKGHTLVFVNYLLVKQGADGSGSAIWGKGENDGLGKASSKDDKMEQIYIIDGISTSIIGTDANRKAGTGESIIYAGKDQALKDTITYTNLEKKRPYIVKYWLVDAETGNMVGGIREEKRTASASGSGTWDVPFNFDATDSKGKKYVAYVEVYENDHLIVDHKEINDKKETFLVPKITTKLRCEETNTNIAENGPTINFEDTITYKNLIPNANYKVETVVMDLGTGKELVDARGSKASVRDADKTFTPSSSNGEHKVHFSIAGVRTDGNNIVTNTLAGKTIVVYQYLYIEKNNNGSGQWVLIADHADMDDKDQSASIKGSGPLYLYLYKRNAGGDTYDNADLSNARFEVAFYKGQKFGSALEAAKKGSLTATFTFRTGLANDAGLGSAPYREAAGRDGINAKYGVDCYPKVDESGNFLYEEDGDGNRLFQNDFLISDKAEYTRYFGQAGTYVVREVEPPVGFSLSGTMKGYGVVKEPTTKLSEGLALYVAEMVNSEGKIIHQYSVDGKIMDDPIISTDNDWIPKDEKGAAIITDDNPEYPELSTSAICLDTNQQYADSQSRAVSILDKIKVKTLPKVDAQYKVTTKIYDLNDKKFIEAHWKKKSDYSEPDKTGDAFETTFSTANDGINAGDTVRFEVGAIVDGTALKGHTIVFINYHRVTEMTDGGGRVIWGADAEGNVLNGGLGVATSMDDKLEMLTFPDQKTDIISTQNGRKGLNGEGIIYAGMYKDDTLQEGHGTRFQVLNDTIYYKNYEPGREYTVKAWLMDVKTQAPALDANNNEIFNMQATQKQIASETGEGTWDISFEFDATGCGDRKYVSYVEISLGSELVADYKDLGDESESFLIPKITTKLKDNETGLDVSYAGETVSLTDTISYSRMMVGADYKVKTKVIDVETKKELVDVHGETVEVPEQVFTAASESGTWDIPISFAALVKNPDGTIKNTLAGKTIVVYEYVYIEKNSNGSGQWVLIADHEDFEDENQRAYLPYIDTLALDEKTRNHISNAEKGLKIHDTVNYKKLNPKYKYRLVSELRDKSTGKIVVDDSGTEQVITTPVTIDAVDGTIKPTKQGGVIFDLNAESFAGRTLVVFERLYLLNGESSFLVADHEDILDEDQTDYIPKVWTRAMVEDIFAATSPDRARIIDTFSYDNLIPGLTYKLKGKVVDKNSTIHAGTDILAGGASENELVFQPESSSGSVRLSFDVNKQNNGVFVVFEELYLVTSYDGADHEILVAKHTDIGDLNQTVYINPTLETSLLDAGTKTKVLDAKEDALLTDTITYKGFDPRLSYVIRGQLIDMETGSVLTDSKDVRVEAEMDAIPDSTGSGQWVMEYKFDASKLAGKNIVAYEEIYEKTGAGTRLVAAHRDFWDKEQRVIIPVIDTVALNPKTNGHIADA